MCVCVSLVGWIPESSKVRRAPLGRERLVILLPGRTHGLATPTQLRLVSCSIFHLFPKSLGVALLKIKLNWSFKDYGGEEKQASPGGDPTWKPVPLLDWGMPDLSLCPGVRAIADLS